MERPLHPLARYRKQLPPLARALLYADQTAEAHVQVLRNAFRTEPSPRRLSLLAARTIRWTSTHPQPRLNRVVQLLHADGLFSKLLERHGLQQLPLAGSPARMRPFTKTGSPLPLETVRDLAEWLRLDPEHLLWFADLQNRNGSETSALLHHYNRRVLAKPYGSIRLVESPKQHLKSIQRQILHGILSPVPLHAAVHGFREGRSILTFAAPHVAREAVLRLDLENFFPSISGPRVQALFRTLGYPEPVADLLGGLCTATTPHQFWRQTDCELSAAELQHARALYAQPHLPQGAPTSPALANLCAFRLDCRIGGLAKAAGAVYTRYADDLAFSGDVQFARRANRFALHVAAIVSEEGFAVHPRKTRLMRPAVRQHLAGLTLNVHSNLPRRDLDLLEAILTNCVRHGPDTQNREQHPDFRRHLEGRVAFVAMVNPARALGLRDLFKQIVWAE
ncbi:MAG TPA: reverse transcriptase family protein [Acidobacteriaceae bacterium]